MPIFVKKSRGSGEGQNKNKKSTIRGPPLNHLDSKNVTRRE
jgi:hypothetical protein